MTVIFFRKTKQNFLLEWTMLFNRRLNYSVSPVGLLANLTFLCCDSSSFKSFAWVLIKLLQNMLQIAQFYPCDQNSHRTSWMIFVGQERLWKYWKMDSIAWMKIKVCLTDTVESINDTFIHVGGLSEITFKEEQVYSQCRNNL